MATERLLMEAGIRSSVGDFANAARTYARLVELQPNVADYRVRLAAALARSPRTARQAEAHFQEAMRLDEDNPELHFKLALYYKAMNPRARTTAELRNALRLDPRHKKAAAELDGA